ncbi:MAG: hypothetical protein OHK0046_09990 [Anaerolineae bacterium]
MSDHPSNPNDASSENLWRTPSTPGTWYQPEREEEEDESSGWRVPTLPKDLDQEPQEAGGWHLPQPEDTIFSPEDEIIIEPPRPEDELPTPGTRPEDIPAVVTPLNEPLRPEDALSIDAVLEQPSSAPLAPEDLIYLIEHIDEDDDEDEGSMPMSELIALASLTDDMPVTEAITGVQSPISADMVQTEDDETGELEVDRLSPAERLVLASPGAAAADDPEEYARQQLAQLTMGMTPVEGEAPVSPDQTGTPDPAGDPGAYARQQLEQLGAGTSSFDAGVTGVGDATTDAAAYARQQLAELGGEAVFPGDDPYQLDPREQELARQYHQTEAQVASLRAMAQNGQISQEDFIAQLRNLMILDDDQVWWMMGVESDTWYKAQGNDWVPATPPVLVKEQQATSNPFAGNSLPYLPDGPVEQSTGGYGTAGSPFNPGLNPTQPAGYQQGYDDFMPLPRDVPTIDPDYTVPSAGAFRFGGADAATQDPYAAPTVPGSSYGNPTVPSPAVRPGQQPGGYGTIESPFEPEDEALPPDIDRLDTSEAPLFEEAAERQRRSTARTGILVLVVTVGLLFLAGAAFIIGALLWYNGIVDEWEPQIASLANFQPEFETVTVLDSDGQRIATLSREGDDRRSVELEQVSPYLIHAVLTLENPNFYLDPGWDFFSILRAFYDNFVAGNVVSGGSTITQQVARNLVLQSNEVSAARKVDELVVAGELTNRYSKNEVLELYLNDVTFYGNQTYGIEAAAQFYFNKAAADLTWPEAALLASIIANPSSNEPVQNRDNALTLMTTTMARMVEQGCIVISETGQEFCVSQADRDSGAVAVDLARVQARRFEPREFGVRYPNYVLRVQSELEEIFGSSIYSGGYTVTTTLDRELQELAQQALTDRVDQLRLSDLNTGAVLVTDPRDGAILAMVGSPDFNDTENAGNVNNTLTWQQPGSAIKPILYAAALQGVDRNGNGGADVGEYLTAGTVLWDVQTDFGGGYSPPNFDGVYRGPVSVRFALQNSLNTVAVKVYQFVGAEAFVRIAQAMGLEFLEQADFSLPTALGATEVRLIDLVQGYGTIANGGQRMPLYTVVSIVDSNGNPIPLPARPEPVRALDPQVAFIMQSILSDDTARQPQFPANSALTLRNLPTQNFVAAKTGTTDNARDLLTLGFTSNRVVGVWLGTVEDTPTLNNLTGFSAAAPLWNVVMQAALQGTNPREFAPPQGMVTTSICPETGTPPGNTFGCPSSLRNEFYDTNRRPLPPEQAWVQQVGIDSWTGLVANEFCPGQQIQGTFVNLAPGPLFSDPFAVQWLNNNPQGRTVATRFNLTNPVIEAPEQRCDLNTPQPIANIASPNGGQIVQNTVPIQGQVSASDFQRYEIQVAPAGTQNFQPILIDGQPFSTIQQPNPGATLATWDTRTIPNGDYTLRLGVFSQQGGFLYRTYQVTVANPQPTNTPVPPTQPVVPTLAPPVSTIPFDALNTPTTGNGFTVPGVPTPTVDNLGG